MSTFDTIVIGSGPGGLGAAVALARAGQRVLVLEQHYLPGGWCHSFTLDGHRFSPGVHYIGELGPEGRTRKLYESLGVMHDLHFTELNPKGFDHFLVGDHPQFDLPAGREAQIQAFTQRFPHEARGIRQIYDLVAAINGVFASPPPLRGLTDVARALPRYLPFARWGLRSWQAVLDAHVKDPLLKAYLSSQAGDHGLPPDMAPAVLHGAVIAHYFEGGFYPRGGGASLPRAFIRELKRCGGTIRLRAKVERILVENRQGTPTAIGVRLAGGEEILAPNVVSNADPHVTYLRMMDPEHVPAKLRRRLARTRYSVPMASLFLATDLDLSAFDSGNYWWAATHDVAGAYRRAAHDLPSEQSELDAIFCTVTSLKDRSKFDGTHHTLEAFTPIAWSELKAWESSELGARPEAYAAFKQALTARMLTALDHVIPGIAQHVTFSELGTPLTNRFYVESTRGNAYGTEKTISQLGPFAFPLGSHIARLHLCGASTQIHGIFGATMTGVQAAAQQLGLSPEALLAMRPRRDGETKTLAQVHASA